MKKNKGWLIQKVSDIFWRVEIDGDFNIQNANIMFDDISNLIDELDEPETLSEKWIENHTASTDTISYCSEESVPVVTVEKLKNLLVPKQDKPVIPQFVIDFIESQDDPIYEMCVNYEMWGINGDDKTTRFTEELSEWLDDSVNVKKYYRACIDGYEVETEKLYRVRAGNRYVRFNLDGSIIGAKKDNSIVCLERLSKLPFDYKKAVESGIITLEEVTE